MILNVESQLWLLTIVALYYTYRYRSAFFQVPHFNNMTLTLTGVTLASHDCYQVLTDELNYFVIRWNIDLIFNEFYSQIIKFLCYWCDSHQFFTVLIICHSSINSPFYCYLAFDASYFNDIIFGNIRSDWCHSIVMLIPLIWSSNSCVKININTKLKEPGLKHTGDEG